MEQLNLFGDEPAAAPPVPRSHEYAVPRGARLGQCRSCGAPVYWVVSPASGASVPLSGASIQTRDGQRYAVSHFRDCPQARAWSTQKEFL